MAVVQTVRLLRGSGVGDSVGVAPTGSSVSSTEVDWVGVIEGVWQAENANIKRNEQNLILRDNLMTNPLILIKCYP